MVKIRGITYRSIELAEAIGDRSYRSKKVGSHKRKINGKTYESAKIILSGEFKSFIGKKYRAYFGDGIYNWKKDENTNGKFILLFFTGSQFNTE